jgi:hypothetical protein
VHLLRGTWAPEIVPRAYRLEEVSRFLRHSSIAVTERYYAHLTIDALPVSAPVVRPQPPAGGIGVVAAIYSEPIFMPDSGSRLGDLNSGPTVYESSAQRPDLAGLDAMGVLRGIAEDALVALARGRDGASLALELATRVLDVIDGAEVGVAPRWYVSGGVSG